MEKFIKVLIIIVGVICIACLIFLKILSKGDQTNMNEDYIAEVQDPLNPDVTNNKTKYNIEKERNATRFYTVQDCVQVYIDNVKNNNLQAILDILDSQYVEDNNINLNNITSFVNSSQGENFVAKKIDTLGGDVIFQYRIYGYITNNGKKEYLYFKIKTDIENLTFAIIPCIGNQYNSLEDIILEEDNTRIEENENNHFSYQEVTREDMCRKYQKYFTDLELNSPEEAYELLDTEYREKRFSGIDDFKKYIEANREAIEKAILSGYSVDYGETMTQYVLQDTYNNYFILKEDSIMNFTIKLDSYNVPESDFATEYKKLKDAEKASANIGIFIQMINTKDYAHAYEKLSDGFKVKYFDTLEKFENYIETNFCYINDYSIDNYKNEGDIYIYNITLTDHNAVRDKRTINKTFNIRLGEGTDFEISFNAN